MSRSIPKLLAAPAAALLVVLLLALVPAGASAHRRDKDCADFSSQKAQSKPSRALSDMIGASRSLTAPTMSTASTKRATRAGIDASGTRTSFDGGGQGGSSAEQKQLSSASNQT